MPKSARAQARYLRRNERRKTKGGREQFSEQAHQEDFVCPSQTRMVFEPVRAISEGQKALDAAIRSNRLIFAIGPAGTGKTYFSAMRAAEALEARRIRKIYITRPAVEAGESLGFLPGEMIEKYEPYIRPLRDAFEEKFGKSHFELLLKRGTIEARPISYLRGATLKDCVVLLDEAQNLTPTQMKMFLTRIGSDATFIVNGDIKQKDIPGKSGLEDAVERLEHKPGVGVVRFSKKDIVRDDMCQIVVEAYEEP